MKANMGAPVGRIVAVQQDKAQSGSAPPRNERSRCLDRPEELDDGESAENSDHIFQNGDLERASREGADGAHANVAVGESADDAAKRAKNSSKTGVDAFGGGQGGAAESAEDDSGDEAERGGARRSPREFVREVFGDGKEGENADRGPGAQEGQEGTTEADPVELDAPGDDRRSGEGAKAGDDTDEESGEENVVGEHGGKDCATGRERLSTQGNPHSRRKSGIWTAGKRHSPYFCWGMRDM